MLQEFGKRLERTRKLRGMTAARLARKVGRKSQTSVYDWETGKSGPRLEMLPLIARALDVSIDYLIGLTDEPVIKLQHKQLERMK